MSWWTKVAPERKIKSATNSTAVYLLPFLMILASGMISRAVTADFEWLYSLRFFSAAAILWVFQRQRKIGVNRAFNRLILVQKGSPAVLIR